jgi:hypothetical protein
LWNISKLERRIQERNLKEKENKNKDEITKIQRFNG